MTTINPYGSAYAPGLNPGQTTTARGQTATPAAQTRDQSPTINTPAVNVTLSPAAQAALKAQTDARPLETVVAEARAAIAARLKAAGTSQALKDGEASIDLSALDRRTLYAVASDQAARVGAASFPLDQQVVATLTLKARQDAALAGPAAQARLTGDYAELYQAGLDHLDAAGPEEKASAAWSQARGALVEGRRQALARPGLAPAGIPQDPVAAYMAETGGVSAGARTRDFAKLAGDVRAALDKQYSLAVAPGAATSGDSGDIDFRRFDARSLAAMALNADGQFSRHEIAQAAREIRARDSAAIQQSFQDTADTDGGFGKAMLTRYAAMSAEERQAAGWTPQVYARLTELQASREKLAQLFDVDAAQAGPSSLLDVLDA